MIEISLIIINLSLVEIWEYKSPRSYGTGGVAVTLEEPQTSFFFNPAGIHKTKSLDIVDIEIYSTYSLIADTSRILTLLEKEKTEIISILKESFGKAYSFQMYSFPNLVLTTKNISFGLGILLKTSTLILPKTPSNIDINSGIASSVQSVLGGAVSFIDDTLKVGLSISPIKAFANTSIEIRENEVLSGNITAVFPGFADLMEISPGLKRIASGECKYPFRCNIGFGGFNIGLIFKPQPLKENLSFGLDTRDILDPEREITIDFGTSYRDKISKINYGVYLDFHDLLFAQSDDKSLLKRTFIGTELSTDLGPFKRFFSLYFGIGQVQMSFALELNFKILSLLLGTYGKELGKEVGGISARYYFFKLSI